MRQRNDEKVARLMFASMMKMLLEAADPAAKHSHRCPNIACGTVWEHTNSCAGSDRAHECPDCGTEQWARDL